jgi:hypothetical protein
MLNTIISYLSVQKKVSKSTKVNQKKTLKIYYYNVINKLSDTFRKLVFYVKQKKGKVMAKFNKEAYERKNRWAECRMEENSRIETLTPEQHETLVWLCWLRHKIHTVNFHIISDWINHNKSDEKGSNNAKIVAC